MFSVRNNTFETNSSSTHSLIIDTAENISKFLNGKLWYNNTWDSNLKQELVTKEDILNYLSREDSQESPDYVEKLKAAEDDEVFADILSERYENEFETIDTWAEYLESDNGTWTTPGGEKVGWVAKYGYDG